MTQFTAFSTILQSDDIRPFAMNSVYHQRFTPCASFLAVGDRRSDRAMVLGKFQCRDVLLIWIIVEQVPTVLAEGFRLLYPGDG